MALQYLERFFFSRGMDRASLLTIVDEMLISITSSQGKKSLTELFFSELGENHAAAQSEAHTSAWPAKRSQEVEKESRGSVENKKEKNFRTCRGGRNVSKYFAFSFF